ncbi:hypothetical protein QDR37_10475 [Amnibacterium sp. CER49]|uniref:hypothetical protein n=1 Tax=Amnibacterium sp. CER49 TaxID=3039161 RepID=UPI0024495DEF|nr:hypothetical protein [Amnibacterium sp. CER49]MDH2444367.1 hypothetical protein [Amnibacterium sp. CER49]
MTATLPAPSPAATRAASARVGGLRIELAGAAIAFALALLAVWHVTVTARSWMLFSDADSVLPALIRGSLLDGRPQDWSLSAVLFLPETAIYLAIAAVIPGVRAALAANGVVNLLLLYAALRLVPRMLVPAMSRSRQVAGALLALAVFVGLGLLDSSASWDAAELPSLITTTTYYSATLIAAIAVVPLAVRATSPARRRLPVALLALTTVSVLTDPLFLVWAVAPLAVAMLLAAGRNLLPWRGLGRVVVLLAAGSVLGLLLRLPFASHIAKDTSGYADPGQGLHVLFGYYLRLTVEHAATPAGAVSIAVDALLLAFAAWSTVRAVRRGEAGPMVAATFGWLAPVLVLVVVVAAGTPAYRYLQPAYFAPLLAVALLPRLLPARLPRLPRRLVAGLVALALVGTALTSGGVAVAASQQDPSIRCLDSWITASHRVGAGRFFTIRGPKAYLADPAQLLQVNKTFHAYLWLVNRDDYRPRLVSFVVTDDATPGAVIEPIAGAPAPVAIQCGRYTITDYGRDVLPVGSPTTAYDP